MNSRWFAYVLLGSVLCVFACKGDGGPTFLEVVSFAPADGRDDVQLEIVIGVRVSERIDPSTLTSETFFLTDASGTVVPSAVRIFDPEDVEPSEMGTRATLTPDEPLAVITDYTVTVTTGLASTSGKSLEEDFDWSFRTIDAAWGKAEWIEPLGTGNSAGQEIVVDGELNAIAVWTLDDDAGGAIYANRYTRVDLWGEAEPISDAAGDAANPKLAIDAAGNAFAVWERTSGGDRNIWANRYDVEAGSWGEAALLQTEPVTRANIPSVAADPLGNAIAVWAQEDEVTPNDTVIRAIRYEPGTGWGNAVTIGSERFNVSVTDVGMDDQGRAIAVWNPLAGGVGGSVLKANRYTPGMGWLDVAEVEDVKSDDTTKANGFRLDVGANGDAVVIWVQNAPSEGDRDDVWAARFSGGTWGAPERVDNSDFGPKSQPDIAVDGTGTGYAVWSQEDEDDSQATGKIQNIWVAEYTPGPAAGWGNPVLIEPPNEDPTDDGNATAPRIDVNRAGNVFVVWGQVWDQAPSIWSNRRDPGTSWVPANAERIEDFPARATAPKIAVDEARHAHSVWLHIAENTPNVRTNRFE